MEKRILLTECADATGLIAKITDTCFSHGLHVIRQDQFASREDSKFFMRSVLEGDFANSGEIISEIKAKLPEGAKVSLNDLRRRRLCVLVTKEAGEAGGFPEKIAAARAAGVRTVVIRRPVEHGVSLEEILQEVRKLSSRE